MPIKVGIILSQQKKSEPTLEFSLHVFLVGVHVPVDDDLEGNYGVDQAAADVS